MDNPIAALTKVTEELSQNIFQLSYEEMESFVQQREALINSTNDYFMEHPVTPEDKEQIEHILSYDEAIKSRMMELKNEAAKWLTQRNAAKSQRSAYEMNYSADSMLMDRKK
ncbi:hypothetical protein AR543_22455 [Paenibacillus bovis]|uniref:Flagellar protein FliT n=1 Tax=Paenibacillus bovis TaxID=1616788 RepID=A0A172ZLQ6_9BACL|nr:hypothetical protein AR543_22455 [Paenibacillus bovis]